MGNKEIYFLQFWCIPLCFGCRIWGEVWGDFFPRCRSGVYWSMWLVWCRGLALWWAIVLRYFGFWSNWCGSRKVLLCRLVLSFAVYLQPPRMCVLSRGSWHLVHVSVDPFFAIFVVNGPPCYLNGVSSSPVAGVGLSVNVVVYTIFHWNIIIT